MKTPTIWMVQALCLIGFFTGPLKVLCLSETPLTMFNSSVDDQYIDCNPERERELQVPGNIPLEEKYSDIWGNAKQYWASLGQTASNFNPIYGTTIVAYTASGNLYSDFNTATRDAGKSQSSYDQYAFKDFHLLLTKALQAKKIKGKCYDVFRGISGTRFTVSNKAIVRFGQFASSSLDKKVAEGFGQDTFFYIRTCYGVPIDDFSYRKEQKEVLIPPYETFTVKEVKEATITLESQGVYSRFNCEVLNDKMVCFGQFAASSLYKKVAQDFGKDTFFSIKTCHGVPIYDFSYKQDQQEVLIPPYETFTVTGHTKTPKGVYITLESQGIFSRCNCEVVNAADLLIPREMFFLLWSVLLTWSTLRSLGSL